MQPMNEEKWTLCQNISNINQMLKVRIDIDEAVVRTNYPNLVIVKHRYTTSDDVLFPELSTLSYFAAFEEKSLCLQEEKRDIVFVAMDINEGLVQLYVYCKDVQKTIYDCIDFFKKNPNFIIDFEAKSDTNWDFFKTLQAKK